MAKIKANGTTLSYLPAYDSGDAVKLIGSLKSIGKIAPTAAEIDVTALDSSGNYKEFLQGPKDSGTLNISGFHDADDTGQAQMRTLYGSGATGYFWVTLPDGVHVIFTARVMGYEAGSADQDAAVMFAASLRISGLEQIIRPLPAVAQSKTDGQTATMDSTATALTGTPTYQWYSNDENNYTTPTELTGETSATYTTGALSAGTYYYFCVISVTGYRDVYSQIHVITVT